ncbi:hypothetical protein ACJJTC_019443 [Scirpophaga incertulas]
MHCLRDNIIVPWCVAVGATHPLWAGAADAHDEAWCARWPYCGAPYFLPVLRLVPRALRVPIPRAAARAGDRPDALRVRISRLRLDARRFRLLLDITGQCCYLFRTHPAGGRARRRQARRAARAHLPAQAGRAALPTAAGHHGSVLLPVPYPSRGRPRAPATGPTRCACASPGAGWARGASDCCWTSRVSAATCSVPIPRAAARAGDRPDALRVRISRRRLDARRFRLLLDITGQCCYLFRTHPAGGRARRRQARRAARAHLPAQAGRAALPTAAGHHGSVLLPVPDMLKPPPHLVLLLGPSHVVVVVSPLRGGRIEGAIPAHPWGDRETYFYTMFAGRRANSTRSLDLILHLPDEETSVDEKQWEVTEIASVMVAGHWMGDRRSASHEEFLKPLVNAAVTGHDVHVRLYTV